MKKGNLAAAAALVLWGHSASALALDVGGVLYFNTEAGGDTLIETSEGDIKAGGIVHIAGGLSFSGYGGDHLETQLTFGMKADSVSGSNGTASFYRWPIELLQFYKQGHFRAGGGLTYHMNPEVECDIDHPTGGCDYTVPFDDALGYVVQADFVLGLPEGSGIREFTLGARYTGIEYEEPRSGYTADGNSIGLSLGLGF